MTDPASRTTGPTVRTYALYLLGVAGLAFSITLLFLEMRAAMEIGGVCTSGGPYASAWACPDDPTNPMLLAIFGGLAWAALATVTGVTIGGRYGAVPLLAWSGLFCSLGLNFLQLGLMPAGHGRGAGDPAILLPGVMFEVMGGVPLALILWAARPGGAARAQRLRAAEVAAGPVVVWEHGPATEPATAVGGVAEELERLVALHASGALTDEEFSTAKTAALRAGQR